MLCRLLESAEALAPFLELSRDVVFAMLRGLVIEESEHSSFGLVAWEPESAESMTLGELLAEAAKLTDARRGALRAPE